MNRSKKMLMIAFCTLPVIGNAMSVKDRARMFEAEEQLADQRESRDVGRLQNKYGYVSKNSDIVRADFARQRALDQIRPVVRNIESREGRDTTLDVVGFVARNKQRSQRGEPELRPGAAHRPHVVVLENYLAGLPLEEQIVVLSIIQNELALRRNDELALR